MTAEDAQEFRQVVSEVVGEVFGAFEKRLQARLMDVEVELALVQDRLDVLEVVLKDIREHGARVSREQIRQQLRRERFEKRLDRLEAERES